MADRLLPSEAMDCASRLVKFYPNGGSGAGGGYLGGMAAALCEYPRQIATKCCHPVHGIARESKFLPTIAELIAWCEKQTDFMRAPVDAEDRKDFLRRQQMETEAEERRIAAARAERPNLDQLKAKFGPNWGLKSTEVLPNKQTEHLIRANTRLFARECDDAGFPADSGVSPSLEKLLKEQSERWR